MENDNNCSGINTYIVKRPMYSHSNFGCRFSSWSSGKYVVSRYPLIKPTGILAANKGADASAENEASFPCGWRVRKRILKCWNSVPQEQCS